MKHWLIGGAITVAAVGALGIAQGGMTPATMIESWFIHAESIGDPVAVEKGFYKDAGLDITVVAGGPGLSPIDRVLAESKRWNWCSESITHRICSRLESRKNCPWC